MSVSIDRNADKLREFDSVLTSRLDSFCREKAQSVQKLDEFERSMETQDQSLVRVEKVNAVYCQSLCRSSICLLHASCTNLLAGISLLTTLYA